MNELQFYDATLPRAVQGWTTIMCTHGGDHPYVANWWPDAHVIGYEHGFTNQAYDILRVLAGEEPTVPLPDFYDAYQTQRVLEASLLSAVEAPPRFFRRGQVASRPHVGRAHVSDFPIRTGVRDKTSRRWACGAYGDCPARPLDCAATPPRKQHGARRPVGRPTPCTMPLRIYP